MTRKQKKQLKRMVKRMVIKVVRGIYGVVSYIIGAILFFGLLFSPLVFYAMIFPNG